MLMMPDMPADQSNRNAFAMGPVRPKPDTEL